MVLGSTSKEWSVLIYRLDHFMYSLNVWIHKSHVRICLSNVWSDRSNTFICMSNELIYMSFVCIVVWRKHTTNAINETNAISFWDIQVCNNGWANDFSEMCLPGVAIVPAHCESILLTTGSTRASHPRYTAKSCCVMFFFVFSLYSPYSSL